MSKLEEIFVQTRRFSALVKIHCVLTFFRSKVVNFRLKKVLWIDPSQSWQTGRWTAEPNLISVYLKKRVENALYKTSNSLFNYKGSYAWQSETSYSWSISTFFISSCFAKVNMLTDLCRFFLSSFEMNASFTSKGETSSKDLQRQKLITHFVFANFSENKSFHLNSLWSCKGKLQVHLFDER